MPARFRSVDATIRWHGVDDDTPPDHTLATGTDSLGNAWLWLFKGDRPTDKAFAGSIEIPTQADRIPGLYGQGGGFIGLAHNTKDALAKLAQRAAVLDS